MDLIQDTIDAMKQSPNDIVRLDLPRLKTLLLTRPVLFPTAIVNQCDALQNTDFDLLLSAFHMHFTMTFYNLTHQPDNGFGVVMDHDDVFCLLDTYQTLCQHDVV